MTFSLAQQDRLIRRDWPFRAVLLGPDLGLWRGRIFGLSAPYEIDILYVRRHFQANFEYAYPFFPRVVVRTPLITRRPGAPDEPIPHVFDEGATAYPSLCLFDPAERGWHAGLAIAHTTIPWAADWLRFYEAWQATGVWTGGGRDHLRLGKTSVLSRGTAGAAADRRASRLIGSSASRALLARAAAGLDPLAVPRWRWSEIPRLNAVPGQVLLTAAVETTEARIAA